MRASADVKAAWTAAGTCVPEGNSRPSAAFIPIVNKPERPCSDRTEAGVGVVERAGKPGSSSAARTDLAGVLGDLLELFPSFQDMVMVRKQEWTSSKLKQLRRNYKELIAKVEGKNGCREAIAARSQ